MFSCGLLSCSQYYTQANNSIVFTNTPKMKSHTARCVGKIAWELAICNGAEQHETGITIIPYTWNKNNKSKATCSKWSNCVYIRVQRCVCAYMAHCLMFRQYHKIKRGEVKKINNTKYAGSSRLLCTHTQSSFEMPTFVQMRSRLKF